MWEREISVGARLESIRERTIASEQQNERAVRDPPPPSRRSSAPSQHSDQTVHETHHNPESTQSTTGICHISRTTPSVVPSSWYEPPDLISIPLLNLHRPLHRPPSTPSHPVTGSRNALSRPEKRIWSNGRSWWSWREGERRGWEENGKKKEGFKCVAKRKCGVR